MKMEIKMKITKVGVVGAGVMGVGVAQDFSQYGFSVILIDCTSQILEKAKMEIENNIRLHCLLNKKSAVGHDGNPIERIFFTTDFNQLENVDFLVENVTEKWEIKAPVYKKIDTICKPSCLFAANTSAISITKIASATKRAQKVLGIHYMNPVPLKKTIEMIKGYHTSEETIDIAKSLMKKVGKKSVVVNDMPGFVSNRVLMLTINEAIFLLQDQVATAEDVDTIFKECFEHKMGPLETADLIGLDTILYSLEVLYESYNDTKFRPSPLLKKMVDAGLYGRKTGDGFYNYKYI